MANLLQRIVTPNFVAFQAHCWFAYALGFTFPHWWTWSAVVVGAGIKEFYVDKHFEVDQDFNANLLDFSGYVSGTVLAIIAEHLL